MLSYLDGLTRYFSFSGRSTRMQYWMFYLVTTLLSVLAICIDIALSGQALSMEALAHIEYGPALTFVGLFHLIPQWAVQVRRLHDIGKSGWAYCIVLIPLIGALILLAWMCFGSEDGTNQYGDPPHASGPPGASRFKPDRNAPEPYYARALRPTAASGRLASGSGPNIATERFI